MAATRACLLALVVSLTFLFIEGGVTAAPTTAGSLVQRRLEVRSLLRRLNRSPVASIQSSDGDVIDCVHISKQPAFDHPLLKNHTIQMRPSYNPRGVHHDFNITPHAITQIWHQNGTCPENTIPIRRTKEEDVLRASSIRRFGKKMPRSVPHLNPTNDTDTPNVLRGHQHAVASAQYDKCYGTKSSFNLWKPWIARGNDFSLTQFWITGGSYNGNSLNTIEAGWQRPMDSDEDNVVLTRSARAKKARNSSTPSAPVPLPLLRHPHPPSDDDVVVDAAKALRIFFNVVDSVPAQNLLRLHFASETTICGKLFMATTALMALLGHKHYDISESPAGVMYVSTRSIEDAVMLESQVHASFGVILSFHRVSTVDREFRYARGEAAAFKLYEHDRF